jgi:putative Holliday junction resolvase
MGLAVGDDVTGIVTPLAVVAYGGALAAAKTIRQVAHEHNAECVVLGLPTSADGEPTPACRRSHTLVRELERLGMRVAFQREFLTTSEAKRRAREAGIPARKPVDHLAAQVLLEEYLATNNAAST